VFARVLTLAVLGAAGIAPTASARDAITPLKDVHRGMACTARTVVQGTEIASFDVAVLDVVADTDGTGARILVRVSGPAVAASGIASGFSGSPVYCPDAKGAIGNAGAISATIGQYGNDVGLVTPIEQMLGLPVRPPSGARAAPQLLRNARTLTGPLTLSGLTPSLRAVAQQAAQRSGRAIVAAPAGPLGTFPRQRLVPGASMAVALATGALSVSAIGTVTYRDGATVYGFGHELDGAGRRSLPLQDAYVYTVIDNPLDTDASSSYKLAAPGHVLGTLSSDALQGVVGTVGAVPATIPVSVTVHDADRNRTVRQRTDVAQEVDVGEPTGHAALVSVAPVAVAQAVTTVFDGAPASESGRMCVSVGLRETRRSLRFCNRYVLRGSVAEGQPAPLATSMSNDLSTALGAIDGARYAGLHVTKVHADVTVARGLALGTILAARAPSVVRAGATATVTARVRLYRGPLRTLKLRLPIPRDLRPGRTTIELAGTAPDEASDGSDLGDLLVSLSGGDSPAPPSKSDGAQSLAEVIAGFARAHRSDGVTAKAGKRRWRAFVDPRLRLEGDVALEVRVLAPAR
jgi:hypothetical protein